MGGLGAGAGGEEAAIEAGETYGGGPSLVDEGDEGFVDLADEDHGDDLHGIGVGDAEAVVEDGGDVQASEPGVNLGAAAMDHDGAKAHAGEEDQVVDHGSLKLRRLHGGAAVLDDYGLAAEFLDEGERFR